MWEPVLACNQGMHRADEQVKEPEKRRAFSYRLTQEELDNWRAAIGMGREADRSENYTGSLEDWLGQNNTEESWRRYNRYRVRTLTRSATIHRTILPCLCAAKNGIV